MKIDDDDAVSQVLNRLRRAQGQLAGLSPWSSPGETATRWSPS
jgi:hypothetical protein